MPKTNQQSEQEDHLEICAVDKWMLRDNLKLSFEERIEQHQKLLDCIKELHELRQIHHAGTS